MSNQKNLQTRFATIKKLWTNFKLEKENEIKETESEVESLRNDWQKYRGKITDGTLSLDDYTNRVNNQNATMPGGYLCNFLERTTAYTFGYSRPGSANQFGVKLNRDNKTYYIKRTKKGGENLEAKADEAKVYFDEDIKGLLKSIVSENDPQKKAKIIDNANYSAKQILMKMAVLDNFYDFIRIYKDSSINFLHNELVNGDNNIGICEKNYEVCKRAIDILDIKVDDFKEQYLLSSFLWEYANAKAIADENSPNVILYGAPGTGKTYSVFRSLRFICMGDSSSYEILQLHPSFTYEDFIEGIKPKGVENGNIRFELVNGVFKNFCIEAKKNPEKEYYFVVDEINRANLSAVFGETLSLLEKDYRHNGTSKDNLIRTQYSSLIKDLIKEDKEKYEHLAYDYDPDEGVKFGIPKNIFFIGTMNDVDKSIDTFDLALRRRFKWIRKDCDYYVIEKETRHKRKYEFSNIDKYVENCKKLNEYISKELGLGKSYELGHSFFMKMSDIAKSKEITDKNAKALFNLYLHPTLKEYLRSVFTESELDEKLNEALKIFQEKLENDKKKNDEKNGN